MPRIKADSPSARRSGSSRTPQVEAQMANSTIFKVPVMVLSAKSKPRALFQSYGPPSEGTEL